MSSRPEPGYCRSVARWRCDGFSLPGELLDLPDGLPRRLGARDELVEARGHLARGESGVGALIVDGSAADASALGYEGDDQKPTPPRSVCQNEVRSIVERTWPAEFT